MQQIYLHGLGQTPDSWKETIARLGAAERTCPDLPGILKGREATYDDLYAGLCELCSKATGPLDLCGLSLGGVLALHYAIDHPQNIHSLVLIGAQYKMPRRLLQFQNLLFRLMPGAMFTSMGFGKRDFLSLCKTMMELDFSHSLQKISCPVLVVCGEKDSANMAASKELAAALPQAELRILSGAGHEVNREAPEQLAQALAAFGWAGQ